MIEGRPDRAAFLGIVVAELDQVRTAGHPTISLYGEMVDLLWQEQLEATLELEGLFSGDVATLRDLMTSRLAPGPALPAAHAALFALDDMPPLLANDIRARARRHYRRASRGGSSLRR